MKKIVTILVVLVILALSACGVINTTDDNTTDDNTTQNTEGTYVTFPWG